MVYGSTRRLLPPWLWPTLTLIGVVARTLAAPLLDVRSFLVPTSSPNIPTGILLSPNPPLRLNIGTLVIQLLKSFGYASYCMILVSLSPHQYAFTMTNSVLSTCPPIQCSMTVLSILLCTIVSFMSGLLMEI